MEKARKTKSGNKNNSKDKFKWLTSDISHEKKANVVKKREALREKLNLFK